MGAPYDGSGRVYLYYGSSDGIHKKPGQVSLWVTSSYLWLEILKCQKQTLQLRFAYFDFIRCSHQDRNKLLCLDILCLATWTWITISTLIWLWDLFLILSLFTGNFTARAQTFGVKEKYISLNSFLFSPAVLISIKMFFNVFPIFTCFLCFRNDLHIYQFILVCTVF